MKKEMTKKDRQAFRKAFNRLHKASVSHLDASLAFDIISKEYYDFSYSDTDDDGIIDTLDYGIQSESFDVFLKKMENYEQQQY